MTLSTILVCACSNMHSNPSSAATASSETPAAPSTPSPSQATSSAFPDATNSGVPAGTTLTVHNGDLTITTNNTVVSNMDIRGNLIINATGVVVKNSKITAANWYVVLGQPDTIVQDCTIDGTGANNDGSIGINGGAKMLRNNIYNVENGITADDNALIQDNFIHDLKASGSPHYDGIQQLQGSNLTIRHNTIDMGNLGETGAVNLTAWSGPINNVLVENNRLLGGSYTIYVDNQGKSVGSVTITGNRMLSGQYGYFAFYNNTVSQCGDYDDVTQSPLDGTCAK